MSAYVVSTGIANTASVIAALRRAGAEVELGADPSRVRSARRVILPGVGSFAAGMAALRDHGLVDPLRDRIGAGRPTLCICLGMQVLAAASEENPGVDGLRILDATVRRLPSGVRLPHLGWNAVGSGEETGFLEPGLACWANSYALRDAPTGWRALWADHGGPFVAAIERDAVVGCQFHPELSGAWGEALIRRWLAGERSRSGSGGTGALLRRVIPCLDTRGGRVVKGVQFQGLRDAGDPVALASAYADQGADEIVLLDVSATPEDRGAALDTVAAVRAVLPIPLSVGGGVRSADDAARLLAAGADRVAVNSAAVRRPALLAELAERFGRQCVVVAVDAARAATGWEVRVQSGREPTGINAVAWATEATRAGAGEVLLTSWDRDGTRAGYDLALVGAVARAVDVPVIASGGADSADDLADALLAGADAALVASILHDGRATVATLKQGLAARGIAVRREGP